MTANTGRTVVIAEPGGTAEGDYATMVRLIHAAADAGANCFKPQWTSDPDAMVARRCVPPEYRRYYSWLQWPLEWHGEFKRIAQARGMQYACSVYLPCDVATIAPLVDYLKISSFEANDPAMRAAIESRNDADEERAFISAFADEDEKFQVVISTGMMQYHELGGLQRWKPDGVRVRLLHCTSKYPAKWSEMNLAVLRAKWCDGLSDHSKDVTTGAEAVAYGSTIIEAHYRLDDCDPKNPDYRVAFSPAKFARYVRNIRKAEEKRGDAFKRVQPGEYEYLAYRVRS